VSHPGIEDPRHSSKIRLLPKTASLQPLTITEQRSTNYCRPVSQKHCCASCVTSKDRHSFIFSTVSVLFPPKRLLLGKVDEWALRRTELLDHRENRTPFLVQRTISPSVLCRFPFTPPGGPSPLAKRCPARPTNQSRAAPFMVPNDVGVKLVITSL
jgi:hypothetical protein